MKIEQKEIKDNLALPIIKEEQIQENIGYNCLECSSLIEIISINDLDNNLEFKCINNDKHNNKLNIYTYLERMKKYKNKKIYMISVKNMITMNIKNFALVAKIIYALVV